MGAMENFRVGLRAGHFHNGWKRIAANVFNGSLVAGMGGELPFEALGLRPFNVIQGAGLVIVQAFKELLEFFRE